MATKPLQSITFPGIGNVYTVPQIDNTLTQAGEAADAKKTGDEIASLKNDFTNLSEKVDSAFVVETATGSIASFPDGADDVPVKDLTVAIEPVQDLRGQANPYPAGGGKNLLNIPSMTTSDAHGLTYSIAADGAIKISGTASATTRFSFNRNLPLSAGSYTLKVQGATSDVRWISSGSNGFDYTSEYGNFTKTYTITGEATVSYLYLDITNDVNVNLTLYIQLEKGSSATSFAPYSNICPINGWTQAKIYVQDEYDATADPTAIIDLNGTIYGGTLDVTTGVLTVDRGYIASYNGETLPSTWISDRDVYASGTTPTTGAQVVYTLTSTQTHQLTPQEVATVLGQNNIFADTGNVTVQYRADTKLYIDKVLNA